MRGFAPIIFDTELNDPLDIYDDTTGEFTIPQDGRYTVNATLSMTDYSLTPQSSANLLLLIDGTPEARSFQSVAASGDEISYVLSIELGLTAGKVLSFLASVGSGTATVLGITTTIQQTLATIRRVE